ncbi:tRNA-dependent cyclodipeptide synthase [Klebsiella michiganensis]|uniref:tRNA-dependent cyclodipeptide synthase n=1 Tax=Klebsiella michiganensis TaxID=1134687 RepID=UPI0032DA7044
MEQHVVFGVSPFNTKFSSQYIEDMLNWGFENFINVDVLHPHEEARYLLMGCNNNEVKARKKSRKEFVRIERIVDSVLERNGRSLSSGRIMKFSDFYDLACYQDLYESAKKEFNTQAEFQNICLEQSKKTILSRRKATCGEGNLVTTDVHIATEYIFREIPFILSPAELMLSKMNISISYYSGWSVADYIYNKGIYIKPSTRTGLIIKDHSEMESPQ